MKDDFSKAFRYEPNNSTEFISILLMLLLIIFTLQFVCQKSLLHFQSLGVGFLILIFQKGFMDFEIKLFLKIQGLYSQQF